MFKVLFMSPYLSWIILLCSLPSDSTAEDQAFHPFRPFLAAVPGRRGTMRPRTSKADRAKLWEFRQIVVRLFSVSGNQRPGAGADRGKVRYRVGSGAVRVGRCEPGASFRRICDVAQVSFGMTQACCMH